MTKKRTSTKPVDRTQIYVAIIGVVGTIVVALITVLANKPGDTPASQIPATATALSSSATDSLQTDTPPSPQVQNGGLCLEDYLKNISAGNRVDLEPGISKRIATNKEGLYGVRLFDGGKLLGEMQFTGSTNSKSFQVISMIDANCSQIFGYANLDRPAAKGAISDWENLGIPLVAGNYRLRMGWYSGNQISLVFSSNE